MSRDKIGAIQPVETWPNEAGEIRAATTTGTGTALTTTPVFIQLPNDTKRVKLVPRNFSTAVAVQVMLNPYVSVLKTVDDSVSFTDYSKDAQDAATATLVTLSSLSTAANGDYLYVGAHVPFRGLNATVVDANGVASVMTAVYSQIGDVWTALTITDGTASGGATVAVTGNITWTVPTDWVKKLVGGREMYWVRFQVSVALDSSTTLSSLLAMNQSTAPWDIISGEKEEFKLHKGPGGVGCIEARTDAGTANLIVNIATGPWNGFYNA